MSEFIKPNASEKAAHLLDELKRSYSVDCEVAQLDPFSMDEFLAMKLPSMNESGDVGNIIQETNKAAGRIGTNVMLVDKPTAIAVTRDLGVLAASLTRHGVDYRTETPWVEETLIAASRITSEIPRDTVFHYGPRNPMGERMRRFTKLPEEGLFINSFRGAMEKLVPCVDHLLSARELSADDPLFVEEVERATENFSGMVKSIVEVRRNISPQAFTHGIRPYFEPYIVEDVEYAAPGGAQMPVLVVDLLCHSSDYPDVNQTYTAYLDDNSRYLPIEYRRIIDKIKGTKSLVTKVTEDGLNNGGSLASVASLMTEINKFRYPHLKVARDNMAIRPDGAKGSGTYTAEILGTLLNMSVDAKNRLKIND